MPNLLVSDEPKWEKAKKIVTNQYELTEKDGDDYWKIVSVIYKKLGGKYNKKAK